MVQQKFKYYKVSGDKLERTKQFCPRCGDGVFLAVHKDRSSCGACGYTVWAEKAAKKKK